MKKAYPVVLLVLAFWPVWQWYLLRYIDQSDEPLGIIALLTAIGIAAFSTHRSGWLSARRSQFGLIAGILLCGLYVATFNVAPQAVHALIALLALAFICHGLIANSALNSGTWSLVILSMPIVATLNFYLGYPLRLLSTTAAAFMLKLSGFAIEQRATELIWGSHVVEVDAPCSGVKMLWFSAYIAAALCAYYGISFRKTLIALTAALISAVLANMVRVTSLFMLDTTSIAVPPLIEEILHQGVGVVAFALCAAGIVFAVSRLRTDGEASDLSSSAPRLVPISKPIKLSLLGCAAIISLFPLLPFAHEEIPSNLSFAGWPAQYDGSSLRNLNLNKQETEWLSGFPGKIGMFTDGRRTIVLRWVTQPTRQLHPSSDCYRAVGYSIKWKPLVNAGNGARWGRYEAHRGNENLLVKERIFDERGNSWSDVSSWYWSAFMKKSAAPWWMVTVVERTK